MDELDNETRVSFKSALDTEGNWVDANILFNKDFADFIHEEETYFRFRFEEIQIIYKAMCDKRFKTLENEL